jgi:hypothetical protein
MALTTLPSLPTGLSFDNSCDFISPFTLLRTVAAVMHDAGSTNWYSCDGCWDCPLTDTFPAGEILVNGPFASRALARGQLDLPGELSFMDANGPGSGASTWLQLL